MGEIVSDERCPACAETGHDSSSNHLMVFADGGKYCNRTQHHKNGKPYIEKAPTTNREPILDTMEQKGRLSMADIGKLPSGPLRARGIGEEAARHYGVRVAYNPTNRDDMAYYYPIYLPSGRLVAYRERAYIGAEDAEAIAKPQRIGEFKRFRNIICPEYSEERKADYLTKFGSLPKKWGPLKDQKVMMFGQNVTPSGGKRLLIVGGQDDMLAAWQILKEKYPQYNPAVVSSTHGENLFSLMCNMDYINSFEEIIVCFDMDDAGRKAEEGAAALIGPRVKVMRISEKDPNDMLKKGKEREFVKEYFEDGIYRPQSIVTVSDVWEKATSIPTYGREWPWPTLTKLTYGRRDGEGIYVGAGVKVGKTEFLTQMIHHIIYGEDRPIFGAKFEQDEALTFQTIVGKRDRIAYHNPDTYLQGRATKESLSSALGSIGDKVHLFKAGYSDAGQGDLWERLKSGIRYEVMANGVKDVFIDPITQLTDGLSAAETETYLRKFSNELQALAQELGFFYYVFCHLKEPLQGTPHEEGGRVKAAQFRGSRAMAEKTKYMLGIERNITADDDYERNTSTFRLLLNSGFGRTGSFKVVYDPETTDYLEPKLEF